ncbi:MAG: phosphoglycerate mutase [Frankiales bacterium]|nr:phosphoglycerate mutase [Frankiales bacterium]
MSVIWLVRHGQTEWSAAGRHTGLTDVPLTAEGEAQARGLAPRLSRPADDPWALVLASPLQRAWRTALLAGLAPEPEPDLLEWDYGQAEGLTTAELSTDGPWRVWDADCLGETLDQVAERVRRVLARVPSEGDTLLVAHGHVLRILAAVYLELDPKDGRHLKLDAGRVSVLGHEHDWPALEEWNT